MVIGSASPEHTLPTTNKLDNPTDDSASTDALAEKKMAEKAQRDSHPSGTRTLSTAELRPSRQGQPTTPHWLVIADSQRRISLPLSGELILGRFDPYNQEPLDVDLTFEDQEEMMISRRHAKIIAAEGYHLIEDLGSSNGLSVNGVVILAGQRHRLQPDDRISVGGILMEYEPVPLDLFGRSAVKGKVLRHLIYLTHRGHKVEIKPPNNVMIGRADPEANFMPTLDLSKDGEVATYVSRRHAIITWSEQTPLFTDLGSTFGTRINGRPLPPNQAFPLKPGDHMSLGGYVLAYDVDK
jgi:pSer/pThr/pTyr-binding forkhead associated (FHA) protein